MPIRSRPKSLSSFKVPSSMFTPKARLAPPAPCKSDSPWTRKLKSSQLSIVQAAFDHAIQDETASHQSIYQHFKSKLPESLILDDDANLMTLTDLCDILALQPTTITDSAILSRIQTLVQQEDSLDESLLCARQAQYVSCREGKSLVALKQSLIYLDQELSSKHSTTLSTDVSQEAAMLELKCKQYEEEKTKLLSRTQPNSLLTISSLLLLTQTLERVRTDKLALRESLSKFRGLPADLDLAALQVEQERRELAELERLRDEMKSQSRKMRI